MNGFLQVFYSVFSSILETLAVPNELLKFGSPFCGMIALVPLYFAIHKSKSFNEAGLITGLQIFLTHIFSSFWLGKFKDFAIFTLGASALAYFFFGFVFGNYIYAVFCYTDGNIKRKSLQKYMPKNLRSSSFQILGFASIWTIYEWFKSTGWLAYPWGTLYMSAYKWHTLKQICCVTGTLGITYLMALFSAVIGEGLFLLGDKRANLFSYKLAAAYCMILLVLSCTFGIHQYLVQPKIDKTLNVTIVQHNCDPWMGNTGKDIVVSIAQTEAALKEYEEKNEKCDLILWNESSLSSLGWFPGAMNKFAKIFPRKRSFCDFLKEIQTPLIGGGAATYENENNPLNSAILFGTDGNIVGFYGKTHLVPFAEEIPYADSEFVQKTLERLVGFSNGWTAGNKYVLFTIQNSEGKPVSFTTPVCFEDAFADLCRNLYNQGSELFVNITNDSWSETNSAEYQHFVVASYRTIEHRTSMVRSCTAGYSVVLDCNGDVIDDLPLFEATHKNVKVPVYERSTTVYSVLGNWIMAPILVFMIWFFVLFFLEEIKQETEYQDQIQQNYEENFEDEDEKFI